MSAAPTAPLGSSQQFVPMRSSASTPDSSDGKRIQLVRGRWLAQDAALLARDRQVEENIRMIVGRHNDVFSPILGTYVDVSKFMTEEERRWRQRPVINKILHWFILTHARLTENPPIVTFQPATSDRLDALLAEAMDTVFKTVWHETEMLEAIDRLMAWLIPGGQAFLKSRVDFTLGDELETYELDAEPDETGAYGTHPKTERSGQIVMDVLGPLECRGEWGAKPWHRKSWHIHRAFLTPDEVYERYQVVVQPDTFQAANSDGTGGYLTRMLFGSGYFGAAQGRDYGQNVQGMGNEAARNEGYCTVDEMWEVPSDYKKGYQQSKTSAGGRLLAVSQHQVLTDGPRPFPFRYCSPLRCFQFINVPGRPSGTTPQEMLNALNKTYNRGAAQILEHRNLVCNPMLIVDNTSGIQDGQITNRPGSVIHVNLKPGVSEPLYYLKPPSISEDVWKTQEWLSETMDILGNVSGNSGEAPANDPSGELVKQLRYNNDRFIGPTAKRAVGEFVRVVQDWQAILPYIWTDEKILSYNGDDNVARTIVIKPEMWSGECRIEPDLDSMIPEGRSERQQRIFVLYQVGIFGQPGTPEAINAFMTLTKFPHMNRLDVRGGVHRVTAQQAVGKIVQGGSATDIPIMQWYNLPVWTDVFEEFMSSPEFLRLDPNTSNQLVLVREKIQGAQALQAAEMMARVAPMQQLGAAHAGNLQQAAQAHGAVPPPAAPGGGGGGPAQPPSGGGGRSSAGQPGVSASKPQAPSPLNDPPVEDR